MHARGTATSELFVAEFHRQQKLKREGRFKYTCADNEMNNGERLAVLVEEVGEVARALCELQQCNPHDTEGLQKLLHLKTELVQVGAVCLAWLESDCL